MAVDNLAGKYTPQWQGTFEAYARRFARENHWRVKHMCDEPEDTYQHCAMIFAYCCKISDDRAASPARFMAFYQRVLCNAFVDLARADARRARLATVPLDQLDEEDRPPEPAEGPTAPLWAALAEASDELRAVLAVIGAAPGELLALLLPDRPLREDEEATLSRSWSRLARIGEVRSDLLSELRMRI